MKLRTFILLAGILSSISLQSHAELSIQITQGIDNPIPIAVVPFTVESGGMFSEDVARIVTNDLE